MIDIQNKTEKTFATKMKKKQNARLEAQLCYPQKRNMRTFDANGFWKKTKNYYAVERAIKKASTQQQLI